MGRGEPCDAQILVDARQLQVIGKSARFNRQSRTTFVCPTPHAKNMPKPHALRYCTQELELLNILETLADLESCWGTCTAAPNCTLMSSVDPAQLHQSVSSTDLF